MKRSRLWKFSAALAVSGAAVAFIVAPWGRAPDLRKVGKRIPMPRGYSIFGYPQRLWISEQEQINLRIDRRPIRKTPLRKATQATAFDMITGGSRPMLSLNQQLLQLSKGDHPGMLDEWRPSLVGKWIAFALFDRKDKRWGFGFARTDGSEIRSFHLVDNVDCDLL